MNNNKERIWTVGMWVGILLMVFLAVVSIKELKSIGYVGSDVPAMNLISVNGTGYVVAVPDIANFSFTVTENAKTVVEAQTKATTRTNSAIKTIKDAGVAEKDIQTVSYSINPRYEYQNAVCTQYSCPTGKSILTGYDVSQSIQVKVRDLTKAGTIFSSIGSLGVQNVNGLDFSVDKPEQIQADARAKAITDAQTKAKELAKQLGVSLVRITSFYESGNGAIRDYMYGMVNEKMVSSAVAPTPELPAGEQKVTSNVTITYEIK